MAFWKKSGFWKKVALWVTAIGGFIGWVLFARSRRNVNGSDTNRAEEYHQRARDAVDGTWDAIGRAGEHLDIATEDTELLEIRVERERGIIEASANGNRRAKELLEELTKRVTDTESD